jgi:hypothetical protein
MNARLLTLSLLVAFYVNPVIAQQNKGDTISQVTFVITPRLNSTGHFPFTGSYLNKHFNADINIFYERKSLGFFLFKSQDLEDRHSIVNYLQPGVFKKVELGRSFKLRFFVGYLFAQTAGFRDPDSDYYAAVVAYWSVSDKVRLEHTALFFDLSQNEKLANRFVVSYLEHGFKFDAFIWHRWVFGDGSSSTSAALSVNFPLIGISKKVSIQSTISYQGYLSRSKPEYAMRNGVLFSVSVPITMK